MATDRKTTARKINAIFWLVMVIIIMVCAYNAWSENGPYTATSFFASLVFHGGFGLLMCVLVDEQIVKHFNKK